LDNEFIYAQTGGHPGLVKAVCYALSEVIRGTGARDAKAQRVIHQVVVQNLATDANTQTECQKIYHDLEEDERAALNQLHQAELNQVGEEPRLAQQGLQRKFIVRDTKDGLALFAPLFADYVRRQNVVRQTYPRGVYLNVDAGAVLVDGKAIETLSDLEYRLLLFLYGRFDQVCDKYAIVETVWGEEYIDKVDDARIEKLISRVRQKIEPDPAHPRYLISLRGRGYKLTR
jgi:DNA-binding winged helix-turn-helix (wHTH) protein